MNHKNLIYLYNIADVTVNMASNEGFGLSGAESLIAGTPIINNVTGGLQDQCGLHYEQSRDLGCRWSNYNIIKEIFYCRRLY